MINRQHTPVDIFGPVVEHSIFGSVYRVFQNRPYIATYAGLQHVPQENARSPVLLLLLLFGTLQKHTSAENRKIRTVIFGIFQRRHLVT